MIKTLFVSNKTQWFLWVLTSIGFSSSSLGPDFNGINIEPSFGTYQLWHHRHLPSKKTWRRPHLASSCHCSKCHWATSIASQRSERQNYTRPCNSWIYKVARKSGNFSAVNWNVPAELYYKLSELHMAIKCTNQFRKKSWLSEIQCTTWLLNHTMEDVKSDFKDINLDHNIWQC